MKKLILFSILLCSVLLQSISFAAPETYKLDPQHTYVLWHINHLGFSTQVGKWAASGTLLLDKENPANSKINATINVAEMQTGIPALDKHLKGMLFFDTKKYPKATFVSDSVDVTSKTSAKVHGLLTIKGISKPVTLEVTLNKDGINPINEKQTAGFSATADIKRSDFGIKTLLPMLGDDVKLDIGAEAALAKKK